MSLDEHYLSLQTAHLGIVSAPLTSTAAKGQKGWLALRPEQLRISASGANSGANNGVRMTSALPNKVTGKVCDFLYIGDVTTYIVELADGLRIEALLANSAPGRVHFFEEGETVELAWPADVGRYLHD